MERVGTSTYTPSSYELLCLVDDGYQSVFVERTAITSYTYYNKHKRFLQL